MVLRRLFRVALRRAVVILKALAVFGIAVPLVALAQLGIAVVNAFIDELPYLTAEVRELAQTTRRVWGRCARDD